MSEIVDRVEDVLREVLEARIEQVSGPHYRAVIQNIREAAERAIAAMREPTGEMIEAGKWAIPIPRDPHKEDARTNTKKCWDIMIDEALK